METKETSIKTFPYYGMLEDSEYYKYIFKKTEKIACAVFYILRSSQDIRQNDVVVSDLESTTQRLLDTVLVSLRTPVDSVASVAISLAHDLVGLEAKLRVAHSARLVGSEILEVFIHEIDSVQRSLKGYIEPKAKNPLTSDTEASYEFARGRKTPQRIRQAGQVIEGNARQTEQVSRRERVVSILRDKGEATIKDVIEVIKDCSEKTIQRELISLIKDNIVHREGERRWSKYRLV